MGLGGEPRVREREKDRAEAGGREESEVWSSLPGLKQLIGLKRSSHVAITLRITPQRL